MSLFDMYAKKPKLAGTIKVKEENAYGYFGMDIREVKENFKESLDKMNQNLGLKGIKGEILFCSFINHEGKNFNIDIFYMFLF